MQIQRESSRVNVTDVDEDLIVAIKLEQVSSLRRRADRGMRGLYLHRSSGRKSGYVTEESKLARRNIGVFETGFKENHARITVKHHARFERLDLEPVELTVNAGRFSGDVQRVTQQGGAKDLTEKTVGFICRPQEKDVRP